MASWNDITASAPEFANAARALFDPHRHKILATLRKDGSPRLSGIETSFVDGDLWLGMMEGSRKALDLRRDARLALHSASVDPPEDPTLWKGDAKLAGRAVEITDPARIEAVSGEPGYQGHRFRVDVQEVVLTRVGDPPDHLVIEFWREGQELQRLKRR